MKFSTAKKVMLVFLIAAFSIAAVGTLCIEKGSSLYPYGGRALRGRDLEQVSTLWPAAFL